MNVLIYSGPEVLQSSFSRCISSLKALLVPHYAVQPITPQSLASNVWTSTCALLVFPACRDHLSLASPVASIVRSYVENGGAFLGLRADARISGSGFTLVDPSEYSIRFQGKVSGASVYCRAIPGDEGDVRPVTLRLMNGDVIKYLLGTQDTSFSGAEDLRDTEILARYQDSERPAAITCRVGDGKIVLLGVQIEVPITEQTSPAISPEEICIAEEKRRILFADTLSALGLRPPSQDSSAPSHLLPQILTCAPSKPHITNAILEALSIKPPSTIRDASDNFTFHPASEGLNLLREARSLVADGLQDATHIVISERGELPSTSDTPLFNLRQYYSDLADARHRAGCPEHAEPWGMGEALLYGEVVTSTQTMLDKNPRFLSLLPSPLLSLASHQLAGRGRGGNIWVSPVGCLQFSLRLRATLTTVPAHRLVFVQYLFALAVVEACRTEGVLGARGGNVRIKWPNDIYIVGDEGEKRKVGGILVHSSFQGNLVDLVVGCGLNLLNPPPIASLSQLVQSDSLNTLSMERTAAAIMATFEPMWSTFLGHKGSFQPFMELYLDRWLHSDQLVTLTTVTPHRKVRITGITDYGLLRTVPERDWRSAGESAEPFIDLQPDGNTFDLMSGLIMTKT